MTFAKKHCRTHHGVLALDVSEAKVPGIVRLDLSNVPFSHFQVRQAAEGYALGYSDTLGHFIAVATFIQREAADRALGVVREKLLGASCGIFTWAFRIAGGIVAMVVAIAVLGWIVGMLTPAPASSPAPHAASAPPARGGVPVDADSRFGQ